VVLGAAFARHEAASGRTAAAPRSHAHAVFAVCASARYVRLRGDDVPSTDHRACRFPRDVQDDVSLVWVDNAACDAGSREESAGAAAAARVLCAALRCACRASACVRCVFDACCRERWLVLRCVAAHRSGCIKRTAAFILVFVQAAAAARVAGGPGILESAKIGDGISVLCHLIADADGVNKQDRR
jgi:hypothetical protein